MEAKVVSSGNPGGEKVSESNCWGFGVPPSGHCGIGIKADEITKWRWAAIRFDSEETPI